MRKDSLPLETFTENGKYGVRYQETGEILIPPKYDDLVGEFDLAEDGSEYPFYVVFSEGLCRVLLNGKWGYIDTAANEVIPLIYSAADFFSEGLAAVKIDGKYGYIDAAGKTVIPPQYDTAYPFDNGLANVQIGDSWGVIDKAANAVIPVIYHRIRRIFDGTFLVKKDNVYSIIDSKGNLIVEYDSAEYCYEDGIYRVEKNGKFGYIFDEEETCTPLIYDDADDFFFCNLACVKREGKYGYINTKGEEVIKPIYDMAFAFEDECNLAKVGINDKCGFIDTAGNVVIPLVYDYCDILGNFNNGLLKVEIDKDESYYLDTKGNRIEKDVFEPFQDETTGKYGFRNRETGEIVVAPEYQYVSDFSYLYGQYMAILGEHLYLTLDGKIHAFSPDEI